MKKASNFTWILTYLVPIIMLLSGAGYGYYEFYVKGRVKEMVQPIKWTVIENNRLIKKIVPVEAQHEVKGDIDVLKRLED